MRWLRANAPGRSARVLVVTIAMLRCDAAQDVSPQVLEDLVAGVNYSAWFTDATGFPADADFFGAYTLQPIGPVLYLGFGASWPAAADGALLGAIDSAGLHAVGPLDEQGVLVMAAADETLLVPGVDPCCPDQWELGNFYSFNTSAGLTKWRNVPNVIHTLGLWYDAASRATYIGTGSHRGDFASLIGELWRSPDLGATWERIADHRDSVGNYRTYDVMGLGDQLYAVGDREWQVCVLVARAPGRRAWTQVFPGRHVSCLQRLTAFDDHILALDSARNAIHVVPPRAPAHTIGLPFNVEPQSLNWATSVHGTLYVLGENGSIMMTHDLRQWDVVISNERSLLSIRHWPHHDWIIVTERGEHGRIKRLALCNGLPC